MATNSYMIPLLVGVFLHFMLVRVKSQPPPLAPALYVFGDSLSDSGNNNFLQTSAKVNYSPYGIDFPSGATGRFTNGKTHVDFLAQYLGLPLVPAYLSLSAGGKKINITTGVNYASGAGGIAPESGSATGEVLSLDDQINYFGVTLSNLSKNFKTTQSLVEYLSSSIFYVSIGNNDYINNYLQPANYRSSQIYTPEQFADRLLNRLRTRLIRLYYLGAKKFVVFNIARLGCVPAIVNSANPKPTSPCVEDVNNIVLLFNNKFPNMIETLERTLSASTFVRGDSYNMNKTSAEAGFSTVPVLCCDQISESTGLCLRDSTPCIARTAYIFWDAFHPTEVVNNFQATDCFSGFSSCAPINVQQLAQKK